MPHPRDIARLQHMLDAAHKAAEFTLNRTRTDLDHDEVLALALARLLEILGEAAKGVSQEFRQRHPHIPWKLMAGTRDRLIHGYFDIDLDIVWAIVTQDLPQIIADLENVLPSPEK